MESALAKSNSTQASLPSADSSAESLAEEFKRAPEADRMSLEAWEQNYKGTNKPIRVPLMKVTAGLSSQDQMLDFETSAKQKLAVADSMYLGGQKTFTGPEGNSFEIRESNSKSGREVGIFTRDSLGDWEPVVRGIAGKDGSISRDKDAGAQPIHYISDWAGAHDGAGLWNETLMHANDPAAKLYMQARESMGKVITPEGYVGSGFFVNKDGLFSTLYHVTNDDSEVDVRTGDGEMHKARLVAKDPSNDTVLLQVEKNSKNETFQPLKVGPFSAVKPGEQLLACGYGVDDTLHASPGVFDFTLQQKDIKVQLQPGEKEPPFDPNRLLAHAQMHTVNGDSGGLEFSVADGTVRLMVDMTDNKHNTVGIPAERLLELQAKANKQGEANGQDKNKAKPAAALPDVEIG